MFQRAEKNRIVRFGKFVSDRAGQFNQPLTVACEPIALLDIFFFVGEQIRRFDFADLMSKQIEFPLARRLRGIQRGMFHDQCL